MSSITKALSGFMGSSPMAYYHRVNGQYFTQVTSSLPFVMRIFQAVKIANSIEKKVMSYTKNPVSLSKTYHPMIFVHSNTALTSISDTHHLRRYSFSIVPGNSLSASKLLLILLLITAVGISLTNEVHAESSIDLDQENEKILLLLKKDPNQRSTEEKIILFNALLSKGIEVADKAKGKDVVLVFGNTGAGKSTLINTIYGCTMVKDSEGGIIVGPNSRLPEIATIGTGSHSCTFIPEEIPDISFSITDATKGEVSIKCFDMPGLSDDRGIEVTLANTIIMQRVIENAQSVRFVMVFEESLISAERGDAWKKAVKLLSERFNGNIGNEEKSLCLVITKGRNDISTVQRMIKKYTPDGFFDLSDYVTVYNPLNTRSRDNLLKSLYQTKSYKSLDTNIALGGDQLWEALKLGDQFQQEIRDDLAGTDEVGLDKAVNKIRFTHEIKKLKNKDLSKPHESAEKAVCEYAKRIVEEMKPSPNTNIENQIAAFKKYQSFKVRFSPFVSFDEFDKSVIDVRLKAKDPRPIAWDKPETSLLYTAATVGAVALTILSAPVAVPITVGAGVISAVFGGTTLYSLKHWIWPSQEEKDISEFLKK